MLCGLVQPVRVLKIEERDQFVGGDPRALHYGFPSLVEVQAFCCGAGISVPALYKCRSSGSGFSHEGDPSLLVLDVPNDLSASGEACQILQFLYLPRRGGLLLAVPDGMISPGLFAADEGHQTGESLIGPGDTFTLRSTRIPMKAWWPLVLRAWCRFLMQLTLFSNRSENMTL